jgi:hypothetical protein
MVVFAAAEKADATIAALAANGLAPKPIGTLIAREGAPVVMRGRLAL